MQSAFRPTLLRQCAIIASEIAWLTSEIDVTVFALSNLATGLVWYEVIKHGRLMTIIKLLHLLVEDLVLWRSDTEISSMPRNGCRFSQSKNGNVVLGSIIVIDNTFWPNESVVLRKDSLGHFAITCTIFFIWWCAISLQILHMKMCRNMCEILCNLPSKHIIHHQIFYFLCMIMSHPSSINVPHSAYDNMPSIIH